MLRMGHQEMEADESGIHEDGGNDGLKNGDDHRLPAHLFQSLYTELVTHGKGDEAEGNLREQIVVLHPVEGGKAQLIDPQRTEAEGADEDTRHQIGGNGREIEFFGQAGEHQARKQRKR